MNTPDITQIQGVALTTAVGAYAAGMRGIEFIAFVILCAVAIIGDALIRRGRASITEAAQYAQSGSDEGE